MGMPVLHAEPPHQLQLGPALRSTSHRPAWTRARAVNIKNSDKPWLFSSGCKGLLSFTLPLLNPAEEQKQIPYTIRLGFKPMIQDKPGSRVFDVFFNDNLALEQFDIAQTAQNTDNIVVKEFTNVPITDNLKVSFVPQIQNCTADKAPIINFIEVIYEYRI